MLNPFLDRFIFTSNIKYTHNNFYISEVPFLIMPTDLLVGICAEQNIDFDRLLYISVRESVKKNLIRGLGVHFGLSGDKFLSVMQNFFTAFGWGGIQVLDIDHALFRAVISVSNSPIADSLRGKVHYPVDHMLRGVFAAMFSQYFKTSVDCVETKCSALGNTSNCEFIIKKAEDFNFENLDTRRQLTV